RRGGLRRGAGIGGHEKPRQARDEGSLSHRWRQRQVPIERSWHGLCSLFWWMPQQNRKGAAMTLTFGEFLLLLLIAAACGALGQMISGVSRGGLLAAIAVGFVGALLGA